MSESVNLPALGESVTEGTVTRWLKNVGDRVEVDEPLLEVSTDKVDTEIPSPIAGIIEAILVAEDETVEVGTALVTIGDGSGAGAPAAEAPAAEAPTAEAPAPAAEAPAPAAEAPAPAAEAPAPAAEAPAPAPAPAAEAPAPAAEAPAPAEAPAAETPAPAAPAAEVPSTEAPAPAEEAPAAPSAPAPADAVDPAPAAEAPAAPSESPAESAAAATPAAPAPVAAPAAPAAAPAAQPAQSNAGYVTPLVRKLAHEKGIDLSSVSGTGVGGRIRKEDLVAPVAAEEPASVAAAPAPLETSPLRGTTVPMSRLRKVIAERAVISMQSSAQLTSVVEVDVTLVANYRDKVKADFLAKTGLKLSFLPFFALAAAEALKAYPIVNATIDGDTIVYPPHENLSIAVDTERGLLTPVIRDASSLDLAGLAGQIADLAERTRDNKLKPDELAGGTFTLTNTGSRGALFDTPIVFLPQSAILGTGVVSKKPVVLSSNGVDSIAIRSTVYLALSYDHRIVDGADAARFLVAVKNRLEAGDFAGNLGV
jgi:2-oxoglutarate dehydrogenase E2 component (dihydrolipoamide succinyltransferase)